MLRNCPPTPMTSEQLMVAIACHDAHQARVPFSPLIERRESTLSFIGADRRRPVIVWPVGEQRFAGAKQ